MKKYFVFLACMFVSSFAQSMGIPQNPINRENVQEADRIFKDKNIHLNFSFGGNRHEGEYVPMNFEWSVKRGGYGGVEQVSFDVTRAGLLWLINKVIEWLQQPSKEDLAKLAVQMRIQDMFKGLESNLEKKQQIVIAYGDVVAKLGQNVEAAQKIYAAQSHSADEQGPAEKYLKMYNVVSDMALQSLKEQVKAMEGHNLVMINEIAMLMKALQAQREE